MKYKCSNCGKLCDTSANGLIHDEVMDESMKTIRSSSMCHLCHVESIGNYLQRPEWKFSDFDGKWADDET